MTIESSRLFLATIWSVKVLLFDAGALRALKNRKTANTQIPQLNAAIWRNEAHR